jgi:hypothetical protein
MNQQAVSVVKTSINTDRRQAASFSCCELAASDQEFGMPMTPSQIVRLSCQENFHAIDGKLEIALRLGNF